MHSKTAARRASGSRASQDASLSIGSGSPAPSPGTANHSALKASPASGGAASKYFGGQPRSRHSSADNGGSGSGAARLGASSSLPLLSRTAPPSRVSSLPLEATRRVPTSGGTAGVRLGSGRSAGAPSARVSERGSGLLHVPVLGDARLRGCTDEVARIDANLSTSLGATGGEPRAPSALDAARACAAALRDLASAPATRSLVPDPVAALLLRVATGLDVAVQGLSTATPVSAGRGRAAGEADTPPATAAAAAGSPAEGGPASPPGGGAGAALPPRVLAPLGPPLQLHFPPPGHAPEGGEAAPAAPAAAEAAGAGVPSSTTEGRGGEDDDDDDDDDDGFGLADDGSATARGGIQIVRVPSEAAAAASASDATVAVAAAAGEERGASAATAPAADASGPPPAEPEADPMVEAAARAAALPPPRLNPPGPLPPQQQRGLGGGVPRLGLGLVKPGGGAKDYHEEFMAGAEDWSLSWREEAGMHPLAALDAATMAAAAAEGGPVLTEPGERAGGDDGGAGS